MDIIKKKLYEVFIDSLEKSKTKEGGLLPDKLFEDIWEYVEPNLGQLLPKHDVSNLFLCGECDEETEHEELSSTTLKCLECGNIAKE